MKIVWAGACAAVLVAAITTAVWYVPDLGKALQGTTSTQAGLPSPNMSVAPALQGQAGSAATALSDIKSLAARCQTAMLQDVCGIMTSSKPAGNQPNAERLFIAGVGEVDAKVFYRLREAGDKMCGEVEAECLANWAGSGCKIARAMYPV